MTEDPGNKGLPQRQKAMQRLRISQMIRLHHHLILLLDNLLQER